MTPLTWRARGCCTQAMPASSEAFEGMQANPQILEAPRVDQMCEMCEGGTHEDQMILCDKCDNGCEPGGATASPTSLFSLASVPCTPVPSNANRAKQRG